MARDYIDIGPVPCNEECEQLGPNYRSDVARAECERFILAIRSTIGPEPSGARLRIKSNSHDFGSYLEVVCQYEDEDETASAYAFRAESEAPQNWPAETRDDSPAAVEARFTSWFDRSPLARQEDGAL